MTKKRTLFIHSHITNEGDTGHPRLLLVIVWHLAVRPKRAEKRKGENLTALRAANCCLAILPEGTSPVGVLCRTAIFRQQFLGGTAV